ncbi:MAG: hypothetical protein KA536_15940 [Saprospiraceae bacterium]|nr:hypothetical protein [Saprospiraceae bacterium]
MPGFILHQGATVNCSHSGQAQPTSVSSRVTVSGMAITLQPSPYTIAACPFTTGTNPSPCVQATWNTAATRVTSQSMPVLLLDSQSICTPNGTPLLIISTQTRVTAQ